jgi:hypothetical protein
MCQRRFDPGGQSGRRRSPASPRHVGLASTTSRPAQPVGDPLDRRGDEHEDPVRAGDHARRVARDVDTHRIAAKHGRSYHARARTCRRSSERSARGACPEGPHGLGNHGVGERLAHPLRSSLAGVWKFGVAQVAAAVRAGTVRDVRLFCTPETAIAAAAAGTGRPESGRCVLFRGTCRPVPGQTAEDRALSVRGFAGLRVERIAPGCTEAGPDCGYKFTDPVVFTVRKTQSVAAERQANATSGVLMEPTSQACSTIIGARIFITDANAQVTFTSDDWICRDTARDEFKDVEKIVALFHWPAVLRDHIAFMPGVGFVAR